MRKQGMLAAAISLTALVACGPGIAPISEEPDAGFDAGESDAGAADSGSDAGAPDSGSDAGIDAGSLDAGSPIVAPADQWTWIDFPDSKCASGTPTGIGINPHAGSTDLVIYLEGGGACTSGDSCWGPAPAATNLQGYDATTFASAKQLDYPLLNRSIAANPLAAKNFVYVPYCTGDLHSGSSEIDLVEDGGTIPTWFWGAQNLGIFLERIVPTFPGITHVWLFGTSAGGFGTMLDYDRVAQAFQVRVDIIDDSGPPITIKGATNNASFFATWGYTPPAGCSGCNSLQEVLDFDRQEQPQSRYAFLSFTEDTVISARFGYTVAEYPAIVDAFSMSLTNDPNAATYLVTNEASHVVESDLALAPQYLPWVTEMVADAGWIDETYQHP